MKDLVRQLQKAHAGELAAYYAYEGHCKVIKRDYDRLKIERIQKDELEHIQVIEGFLKILGSKPDRKLDLLYTFIGKVISALCYIFPLFIVNKVAGIMEHVGAESYQKISHMADNENRHEMADILNVMCIVEMEHREYFDSILK